MNPIRRKTRLVIETLGDDTLVYDLDSHAAHALGPIASRVWRRCDGRSSAARIARRVARETSPGVDVSVVEYALERLAEAGLLDSGRRPHGRRRLTRRELVRVLGIFGGSVVMSIAVPVAAQAATCVAANKCTPSTETQCCGTEFPDCVCMAGDCRRSSNTDIQCLV